MSTLEREHAPFPPSSIARIVQCPGSWRLCQRYPGAKDSVETKEGDAAHWVESMWVMGVYPAVNDIAPNGVPVNEEMREGAELYADAVGYEMQHVEEKLPPSSMIDPENYGTPDGWSYKPIPIPEGGSFMGGVIEVIDYKYGHRFVDVYKCWQLINYALLIIDSLGMNGFQEMHTRVNFTIVQPRNYHPDGPVRKWSVMASDLRAFGNIIKTAISAARSENAKCHVGPECRDCSARAHCMTLQHASLAEIDQAGVPTALDLPPESLGLEIRLLRRALATMSSRLSGLEEVAMSTLRIGTMVPGFTLRAGLGRERWSVPVDQVTAMGEMYGITLTEPKPITPKQAIKLGVDEKVVASMTERPNGKITLEEDDGSLADKAFGKML